MLELFFRWLASFGYDKPLYSLACEEEANHHYMEADMRKPTHTIVVDKDHKILANHRIDEFAIAEARTIQEDGNLIVTTYYDDGSQSGRIVGPVPF